MRKLKISIALCLLIVDELALCFTANKVWFETMPHGAYKVIVNYTVPELKEFRESYVIFYKRAAAEQFYWALVRGADFFPGEPYQWRYQSQAQGPDPW